MYYGFQGFDPTSSPKQEARKKSVVVTPQDMDMIDYAYHKVIASKDHEIASKDHEIASKDHEISVLETTIKALMRDHKYKDEEMERIMEKYHWLKQAVRVRERQWAIEKQQLLEEIDWALRGVSPEEQDVVYHKDNGVDDGNGFQRGSLSRSPTSVRILIDEREAEIAKDKA